MYDDRDISGLLVTPRLFGDGLPDLLLKLLGGRCRRRNLLLIKSSPEIREPGAGWQVNCPTSRKLAKLSGALFATEIGPTM